MKEREERRERDVREERKSRRSNTNSQRKRIINKESQNVIITVHIIKYLVFSKRKKRKIQSPEWRRVSFDWLVGSQNISILDKKESGLSTHHHGNKRRSK